MKYRRTGADQRRRQQHGAKTARQRQQYQTAQRKAHPNGERPRHGIFIRPVSDDRLEQGGGELEGQGNHSYLHKGQGKL